MTAWAPKGIISNYRKVTNPTKSMPSSRMRQQTLGVKGTRTCRHQSHRPTPPFNAVTIDVNLDVNQVQEDDTADIALLSEGEPLVSCRRRACTTSSLSTPSQLSNILNPLSRLAMRRIEQPSDAKSNKTMPTPSTSTSTTPDLLDSPPPLITKPPMLDAAESFMDLNMEDCSDMMRPAFENTLSIMTGTSPIPATLTLDMLTTKLERPGIPSHLSGVLLHNKRRQSEPESEESAEKEDTNSEMEDDEESHSTAQDYEDRSLDHSMDIDNIRQNRDQSVANFEALLRDSNPFDQNFGTNEDPKIAGGLTRNVRGLSSPAPMRNQVTRPRKGTMPDNKASNIHPLDNEVPLEPIYHGQELHLVFKIPTDQTIQVQGQPMRRKGGHENPFSRRVRCHKVGPYGASEDGDTLRIIGHTMDGILRGGDCVSFARMDGKVLRMQSMSKKLTFSSKIDVRAKFVIIGVPDRVAVTSTSKFYLQSLYDRKKTVGFLRSRRNTHSGCLAMYFDEKTNEKVEPIQFFKRYESQAWH
ncbi:hypothetical protein PsorP6_003411 [Peronosclerospora sorghi]|uniref:Uncharacterized protein n=1 Tax=Peronosclerospora sorghi TaxID=230839 RepID=A0ACC0VNV5_9STRA|nr:hypothetical protein PsorP6_003411 [Peronosclerospora sorghi]